MFFLSALFWPTKAFADVIWPALLLEGRLFSWWAIACGLLIEYVFVRCLFKVSARRALLIDLVANGASSLLGLVLIPVAGLVVELFASVTYLPLTGWGTLNPVTWVLTVLAASVVNGFVERSVMVRFFRLQIPVRSLRFLALVAVNAVTVGVSFISFFIVPVA